MKQKIFRRICLTGVLAALLSAVLICGAMYITFANNMRATVRQDALLLLETLNANDADDQTALRTQKNAVVRITLIAPDGAVLFDNMASTTENHAARPEVKAALLGGAGEAARLSDTLQKQTYYYAVRTSNGNVLRTAATSDSIFASLWACLPYVILAAALGCALAFLMGRGLTRRLVAPINAIDVERPLENETYDELTPLLLRIDKQNRELAAQMKTVEGMRDDLADIMENMAEGLMVLGQGGTVLSVNHAALSLFEQTRTACVGASLLAVYRGEPMPVLLRALLAGENAAETLALRGRVYEAILSQAQRGGAILLLVDVTEKRAAEQLRREFSANVSHELKTPLQAISGYAELLQSGMAAPADAQTFAEKIYQESGHLIALVQDIIKLSRLDEDAAALPRTPVNLHATAQAAVRRLADKANKLGVTLTVDAASAPAWVDGVPALLEETIYNLADNALTYNKPGGSATVRVQPEQGRAVLTVTDTGVGIPAADRARVFERFYRVDKSHARATGGTGLGLSIVKHAAALHGASLKLDSEEGRGSEITLRFPPTQM